MFNLVSGNNYLAIPNICEIDFTRKSNVINGCKKIISQISYSINDKNLFRVKINFGRKSFFVIFQKFNLYIVGVGSDSFGYITNNLDDVRYLESEDFKISKENLNQTFEKVFNSISKNSSQEIFNFFTKKENSKFVRILIFSLAEVSKNDFLRDIFLFNLNLINFRDLKSDSNLFPNAKEETFCSYNNLLIFILNWDKINRFKGALLPVSLTAFDIRNYFLKTVLTPKEKVLLQNFGILG